MQPIGLIGETDCIIVYLDKIGRKEEYMGPILASDMGLGDP